MTEYSSEDVERLSSAISKLADAKNVAAADGKVPDPGVIEGAKAIADDLAKADLEREDTNRKAIKALVDEQVKAALLDMRSPSMAAAIGQGVDVDAKATLNERAMMKAHP